ncbi:hypothetical protein D3C80_1495780 [compost metagenome]
MAGVAARAGADAGQAVHARVRRLLGQGHVDHVGEDQAAIGLDRLHDRLGRAQGGDDDGRLVLGHQGQILGQTGVGRMGDQVGDPGAVARRQGVGDLAHPGVEVGDRAAVGGRKGAAYAGLAGGDDQFRPADQEHGRRDHGQAHRVGEGGGHADFRCPDWSPRDWRSSRFSTLPTGLRGRMSMTSSRSICL